MRRRMICFKKNIVLFLTVICVLMAGCGESSPASAEQLKEAEHNELSDSSIPSAGPESGKDFVPYKAPSFQAAVFHEDKATGDDRVKFDFSAASDGYIGVSATSSSRLKLVVVKDEIQYIYDVRSDGTPSVFPLQCGSGTYHCKLMENISGKKYGELYAASCEAAITDEYAPFLRPSDYVNYNENSECVKKAKELAALSPDAVGVVAKIYEYVTKTVTYDYEKAKTVQSGYLPVPDETMKTGKGICFDYASLAAAMLRSQGIPTKLIFGYVAPDDLYHAWNMFYTKETGWVTVDFQVDENQWVRLDLTFAANGSNSQFIGDGSNYSDLYYF